MSPYLYSSLFFLLCLRLGQSPTDGATCPDCFIRSRATNYPNSDIRGTEVGACGFGSFGAGINKGYVTAASNLYRDGAGCGACYQVRCTKSGLCSDEGVTVVITDSGWGDNTDFILSRRAYKKMARNSRFAAALLAYGVVEIEYRRVACNYSRRNIVFKIEEVSNPYYLSFIIRYQQGKKDISAVQLCDAKDFTCRLLDRSYGAVWAAVAPPTGPLSIRMLMNDDSDEEEKWVVPVNNIPANWKAGHVYDSGVQVA